MTAPATVLLVSGDAGLAESLRSVLALEEGTRLVVSTRENDALELAREARPDLVLVDHELTGSDAFRLCRRLRTEPGTAEAMLVLVVPAGSTHLKLAGLVFGLDEYLSRPVEAADLLTKVRWAHRLKRVNTELRTDRTELERLHDEQRRGFDHLLELLVSLVELRLPGSAARGARVAELARGLAARFEIPEPLRRDLDIAARLHEMGRVLAPDGELAGESGVPGAEGAHYVHATRALLGRVDGLHEVADIVGGIFENWDGTGFPRNLQQGQIPLRSRILRVLVDLTAALDASSEPELAEVLERMAEYRGTWYDPMVVVHLQEMLAGTTGTGLRDASTRLPISALEEGMVLAEDLCTDTGLKLLARGTRITASALEIIRRRHSAAPILDGAAVARRAA